MSIALSEFWTRLQQSGFADATGCQQWADQYAQGQGIAASDPGSLASFLIQQEVLTEYQALALLAPSPPNLRVGNFLLRSDQPTKPLRHWLNVRCVQTERDGFLLRVPLDQLSDARRQWLAAHAVIDVKTLQPFQLSSDEQQNVEIFSRLAPGRGLYKATAKRPKIDTEQAVAIGIDLAAALTAMHQRSLIHGAVRRDHVWLTNKGSAVLLRDPSGPPLKPRDDAAAAWVTHQESPGLYTAPELSAPGAQHTIQSDIYSLGCLLLTLISGENPFDAETLEHQFAAHSQRTPESIAEAVRQGESGDPILRVLAFALAKNPTSRFGTAAQFADALAAARNALAGSTQDPKPVAEDSQLGAQDSLAVDPDANSSSASNSSIGIGESDISDPAASSVSSRSASGRSKRGSKLSSQAGKSGPGKVPPQEKNNAPSDSESNQSSKSDVAPKSPRKKPAGDKRESKNERARPSRGRRSGTPTSGPESPKRKSGQPATEHSAERDPATSTQPPAKTAATVPAPPKSDAPVPPTPPPTTSPSATQSSSATPESSPPPGSSGPAVVVSSAPPQIQTDSAPSTSAVAIQLKTDGASAPVATRDAVEGPSTNETGERAQPLRKRRRRKKNVLPILGGLMVIPVLLLFLAIYLRSKPPEKREAYIPPTTGPVPRVKSSRRETTTQSKPDASQVGQFQLVQSDQLLYVPPITEETDPPPLDLLPPGPAVIVSVRLREAMQSSGGREIIDAVAPDLQDLIDRAVKRTGVSRDSIDRLTIALHSGKNGWPEASLAVELSQAQPIRSLAESWGASASGTPSGATVYAGDQMDSDAYFVAGGEQGKVARDADVRSFAVASAKRIKEIAEEDGGPILLPRALQTLWSGASNQSHFVMLITPNFLFADGREMLQTYAPRLAQPLKKVLIPDVAAMTLTVHSTTDQMYFETRLAPSGGTNQSQLVGSARSAINGFPLWADEFVIDTIPDASWRLLASRLPSMLRFVKQNTRTGISGQAVVSNFYLPTTAASQITLATLLAMNTAEGASAGSPSTMAQNKSLSVEEMLNRKMSISFTQESLQFAVDAVIDEFVNSLPPGSTMPKVRIVGSDLEKNGITQNQQIRNFEKSDLPLRTVLTELVLGANPDKTATGPKDPKQTLVWVVTPEGKSPSETEILITIRSVAEKEYSLPPEFVP